MSMLLSSLRLAVRAILANKMRSFLTMLGVIIGVTSMVALVSIGQGATGSVAGAISSMGAGLLTVSVTDEDVVLTREDYEALEAYDAIAGVAPYVTTSSVARAGDGYMNVSVYGVTESFLSVAGLAVQAGRGVAPTDLASRTNVAVIGVEVAGELFESYDVIGKTITMDGRRTFTIVGLLEESGSDASGSLDSRVLIPLTTGQRLADSSSVNACYVAAASSELVAQAQALAQMRLLELTRDEDAFDVYDMSSLLDTLDDVMSTLSLMLGGIAAIALLVGGVGIMNIMLVSVAERTREIGIRKAIGARRAHILLQFLIEACALSLLGCLLGLALSALVLAVFSAVAGMTVEIEWRAAAAAVAFSAVIGVAFGGYPAAKASRMTPIDALQRC